MHISLFADLLIIYLPKLVFKKHKDNTKVVLFMAVLPKPTAISSIW